MARGMLVFCTSARIFQRTLELKKRIFMKTSYTTNYDLGESKKVVLHEQGFFEFCNW